jgi:D-tyrosyl-tRNA(Tyr) deacylase
VQPDDAAAQAARLAERVLTYRVFSDREGRMNRSLLDERLGLLAVPQFTLAADTKKGTRASFTKAAAPELGRELFEQFVVACSKQLPSVETGRFGAHMKVSLENDGPVTFWLET